MGNQSSIKLGMGSSADDMAKNAPQSAVVLGHQAAVKLIDSMKNNGMHLELARDAFNSMIDAYLKW
jgi:hypothetical protein